MKSFEQHSDGRVYVRNDLSFYVDTLSNYLADAATAAVPGSLDALPENATERVYVQNGRHSIQNGNGVVAGGPRQWDYGDAAIAAVAALLAAQAARNYVPPPPAPDVGTTPPKLIASALQVLVSGGDVSSISGVFNLVGAIYLDVGQYMLLFLTPQPDTDYFPLVADSGKAISVLDKETDYLIVQFKNPTNNQPVDPASFSVNVYRV